MYIFFPDAEGVALQSPRMRPKPSNLATSIPSSLAYSRGRRLGVAADPEPDALAGNGE